jgi:hypothetical protein
VIASGKKKESCRNPNAIRVQKVIFKGSVPEGIERAERDEENPGRG